MPRPARPAPATATAAVPPRVRAPAPPQAVPRAPPSQPKLPSCCARVSNVAAAPRGNERQRHTDRSAKTHKHPSESIFSRFRVVHRRRGQERKGVSTGDAARGDERPVPSPHNPIDAVRSMPRPAGARARRSADARPRHTVLAKICPPRIFLAALDQFINKAFPLTDETWATMWRRAAESNPAVEV